MVSFKELPVLVTGGTGFIGSRLAERLAVEEQAKVRVLVRDWRKAVWISRANVELVQGDVRDSDSVVRAMQGCQIVFHCAASAGTRDECISTNVDGTRNVLQCAAALSVDRVVCLSSVAVHGPTPPDNADEQDELRPTGDPYVDSKIAAEKVVWQFWHQHRFPVVVIRPAAVWGPRGESFTLWPLHRMKSGQWFLLDHGRGTCNAVYIDNLVDALLLAGLNESAVGEGFLITDGQPCSWAEFFGHYARMLGIGELRSTGLLSARFTLLVIERLDRLLNKLKHTPQREPARILVRAFRRGLKIIRRLPARFAVFSSWEVAKYAHRGKLNVSKARRLLGYTPRLTLNEGMRETEIWLRDQRIL
jgi:nucleoside-diphosphate-sugar epimerase